MHTESPASIAPYCNYFRDYDSATGRFAESDPIGLGGGVNTYGYTMGNPVWFSDPSGLDIFRGPGNYYSDIPPTSGCERAAYYGGYIHGWGPCGRPELPPVAGPQFSGDGGFCTTESTDEFSLQAALWDTFGPDWTWLLPEVKGYKILASVAGGFGLGGNPFKRKTANEIAQMLEGRGFVARGPNPIAGRGTFVNPNTGRGYHIDASHPAPKGPHVGVHRPRNRRDTLPPRDYPMGP